MRRLALLLVAVGTFAGMANAAHAQPIPHLTPDGYGPVRIGMTRAEAERALGVPLEGEAIEDPAQCIELFTDRGHVGIIFMFEANRLTRITISEDSRATTPRGIGIDATEAQVRRAYPRGLRTEPHKYVELPARYLTYWLRPGRGVRLETDEHRRVRNIHAGTSSIEYVEGCA